MPAKYLQKQPLLPLAVILSLLVAVCPSTNASSTIPCPLADGFDFPVGKPDAHGYYKARGFWPNGHLGEDWNGRGGGNTDLGDPVYAIADGVVVLSRDVRIGWGNVVIIRHAYRDKSGKIILLDSLYGHLDRRAVNLHDIVKRGQKVGTIGTAHGKYYAHLHFEIRKNLKIGMNRSKFGKTYANYHSPTPFIRSNRKLDPGRRRYPIPLRTFAPYGKSLAEANIAPPEKSVVPLSDKSKRRDRRKKLKPELEEALRKVDEAGVSDEDIESFWKRLRTKLKKGEEKKSS